MKEITKEELEQWLKNGVYFVFQFHCDMCQTRHHYQAPKLELIEDQLIKDGWTHRGSGLACPDCSLKSNTS